MQRTCFLLRVKSDRMQEYRQRHREVWPEMQQALSETGWGNYSLFLATDGLLVGYVETEDFQAAVAGMQVREVNIRWQAAMADLFEELVGDAADSSMRPLEEVFHLD